MEREREEGPDLGEWAARIARELVAERFPEGEEAPRTLEEMEEALTWIKRELGERLQRVWIDQQESEQENQRSCPRCRGAARFFGSRERSVVSRHGEMRFPRRWYHCSSCQRGFAPLDERLCLDGHAATPTVRAWLAELGSEGSFEAAVRSLERFTDIRLSESSALRVSAEVGRRLREEEIAEADRILRGEAVPRRTTWQPARLYLSLDGAMAPLREPWKRDGSLGALQCRYGECKSAVCYETRPGGGGKPEVFRRQYTATLESVETFEKLVAALAYHCGSDQARELAVLADGAAYNWRIANDYFPEAIQILDLYHALEHLHTLARLCLEASSAGTGELAALSPSEWVAARKEELLNNGAARVRQAILSLPAESEEARQCREETAGYFARNEERMRYQTFLEAGYQIASGVMEATCKTVVHQRLDQSGMHWRLPNADAIVALRANQLSHQPRDLRPYCSAWN